MDDIDAYIKIQFNGQTLRLLEFDLHYGKDYISLHGAATLAGTSGNYGPVTGTCAFQSETVLFCNTDLGVTSVAFLSIHFDEEGDIIDIVYSLGRQPDGEEGNGTVIEYQAYPDFVTEKLYARWSMGGGTGINTDLTVIEMDIEVGPRFLALHGKATRQSGAVPLAGTCVRQTNGDYFCVTDYSASGDMQMLLRPSGNSAIMAMRSHSATGPENGRATGTLVELR